MPWLSPARTSLSATSTTSNDIGEIAVTGTLPNGDHHAVLLVPHGDCDDDCEGRIAASQNDAAPTEYAGTMAQGSESRVSPANQFHNRLMQRYRMPGQVAPHNN